jgi:hypothetical protein
LVSAYVVWNEEQYYPPSATRYCTSWPRNQKRTSYSSSTGSAISQWDEAVSQNYSSYGSTP